MRACRHCTGCEIFGCTTRAARRQIVSVLFSVPNATQTYGDVAANGSSPPNLCVVAMLCQVGTHVKKGWERSFAAVVTNVRSGPASITTPRGLRHRRPPIPALPYRALRDPRRHYSAAARAHLGRRSWCRGKAVDAHEEEASHGGHTRIRRRGNARLSQPHSARSSYPPRHPAHRRYQSSWPTGAKRQHPPRNPFPGVRTKHLITLHTSRLPSIIAPRGPRMSACQ